MTFILVYLLSAFCYIALSFVVYKIAKRVFKKKQRELKLVEAGLVQWLGGGFMIALILGSLTAGYKGIWAPAIVFVFCFLSFGLLLGLLSEFTDTY